MASPVSSDAKSGASIVLYVKAGADGQRYGACPFCQRLFMILLVKSLHSPNQLSFRVATINLAKPPAEFRARGLRRLPALADGEEAWDSVEDSVAYLDQRYPGGGLAYDNPATDQAVKDIFSRFCFYIKAVSKDPTQLEAELRKLNHYLQTNGTTYLCGSQLSHLDCELLPKLQHVRVACEQLKHYYISPSLSAFWRYMHEAYNNEIFTQTCPSDQDIILHWVDRPETAKLAYEEHKRLVQEKPKLSTDVPAFATIVQIL